MDAEVGLHEMNELFEAEKKLLLRGLRDIADSRMSGGGEPPTVEELAPMMLAAGSLALEPEAAQVMDALIYLQNRRYERGLDVLTAVELRPLIQIVNMGIDKDELQHLANILKQISDDRRDSDLPPLSSSSMGPLLLIYLSTYKQMKQELKLTVQNAEEVDADLGTGGDDSTEAKMATIDWFHHAGEETESRGVNGSDALDQPTATGGTPQVQDANDSKSSTGQRVASATGFGRGRGAGRSGTLQDTAAFSFRNFNFGGRGRGRTKRNTSI